MDAATLSRATSQSSGRTTLVSSDNGLISLNDLKFDTASPAVRDNRLWLPVVLPPEVLKLYYAGVVAKGDRRTTKTKSRVNTLFRRSKVGFDLRFRRSINDNKDEITDVKLETDPRQSNNAFGHNSSIPSVHELEPGNIFEAPGTAVSPLPQTMTNEEADEGLPLYQARSEFAGGDVNHMNIVPVELDASSLVVSQPRSVLMPSRPVPDVETDGRRAPISPLERIPSEEGWFLANLSGANLAALESALGSALDVGPSPTPSEAVDCRQSPQTGQLRVVNRLSYEIDAGADPPSSPERTSDQVPVRERRLRFATGQDEQENLHRDADDQRDNAERPWTRSKKATSDSEVEVIWAALLKDQSTLLGPEHPLIYQAKHELAMSRLKQHKNCPPSLLSAFKQSRSKALDVLGAHPLLDAFSANLELLADLIIDKSSEPAPKVVVKSEHPDTVLDSPLNVVTATQSPSVTPSSPVDEGPSLPKQNESSRQTPSVPTVITELQSSHNEGTASPQSSPRPLSAGESLWNVSPPPHAPRSDFVMLCGLIFGAVVNLGLNGILWLQRNYGPEPIVEADKVRVRWTCTCGEQLYDDFVERRRGAARELEAYLNRSRTHNGGGGDTSPVSPASTSAASSFVQSSQGGPPSSQTTWSGFGTGTTASYNGKEGPRSPTSSSLPLHMQHNPYAETPWLLTCANEDRFTPKVAHLDMSPHKIKSDRDLAIALRQHYFHVNRQWWRALKLRGLTTIEFVQFECHQNRFADIRKCPDMPPRGRVEYDFEPGDLLPPVGSIYLLHLFRHPEDYDGEILTYLRAPKKTGRLQLGVGWGINLVEGFLADRVWMLVNVFLGFVSLVFAIAWALERSDVQGAFGVAQWICMLAAGVGGYLQARFA